MKRYGLSLGLGAAVLAAASLEATPWPSMSDDLGVLPGVGSTTTRADGKTAWTPSGRETKREKRARMRGRLR